MASRKGSLLEKNIAHLFKGLGFDVQVNVFRKGYEIDVIVQKYSQEIFIECKQYEKSSLTIRNLIHQWSDKSKEINAHKIILVLYGVDIKASDIKLASERNIILWDEKTLHTYIDLASSDKDYALKLIEENIFTSEIEDTHRYDKNIGYIREFLALNILGGRSLKKYNKNQLYKIFIKTFKESLQKSVRNNVANDSTEDLQKCVKFFSKFDNETLFQSYESKWMKLKKMIDTDSSFILPLESKENLLEILSSMDNMLIDAIKEFESKDAILLRHDLIKIALNLLRERQSGFRICFLSKKNKNRLYVHFYEGQFYLILDKTSLVKGQIDKLDWLVDYRIQSEDYLAPGTRMVLSPIIWTIDNNLDEVRKSIEKVFLTVYDENEEYEVVLKGIYKNGSWVFLIVMLTIGIITLQWFIGIIFLLFVIREFWKILRRYSYVIKVEDIFVYGRYRWWH